MHCQGVPLTSLSCSLQPNSPIPPTPSASHPLAPHPPACQPPPPPPSPLPPPPLTCLQLPALLAAHVPALMGVLLAVKTGGGGWLLQAAAGSALAGRALPMEEVDAQLAGR